MLFFLLNPQKLSKNLRLNYLDAYQLVIGIGCLTTHTLLFSYWLMPNDFEFFSIGIVIFGCHLSSNQFFKMYLMLFVTSLCMESQTFGNANRNMFVISEKLELDGFSF